MNATTSTRLHAGIVLASAGRPALLSDLTSRLAHQTVSPVARVVSVPDEASLPPDLDSGWTVVTGTRGLAAQRNAGLAALGPDADVVFFFDDDAIVRRDYLEQGLAFFAAHPEHVGLTGRVLLDGAASRTYGEVDLAEADRLVAESEHEPLTGAFRAGRTLFGANFAFRRSAVPDIEFDPRLPLYSWLEDHDFARRLMRHGPLAHVDDCVIVHRGAASGGRTNHVRLGYSQLMNPVYLQRAGSFPRWLATWELFRPIAKNVAASVGGPQADWRRERLRGNGLALGDVLRGRITPERITSL
ncbi:glycosyltransferase [Demequina capsici]|uniref:Glycosyltransferase n=1 Tax=Demequina capsici TaxID=3075620 RepID=A0AA96FFD9_9MICO|nr:glycosyltransferase [Demequina sp. PMTSA13]WNM28402.1 glycosyltransferase [Demequina sp. PMTSA13]